MSIDIQEEAIERFGIELSTSQMQQFERFHELLNEWNQKLNLTTIIEPDEVRVRHFLDSLSIASILGFDEGDKLIDVGTGAGFPGLPLAIAFPDIHVTLMDSTQKKLSFIQTVIEDLDLENAVTLHSRAEDAGNDPNHREQYNIVTARAVALLPTLLEYTLPLAKVGGFVIAMKGESAEREVADSKRAFFALRAEPKPVAEIHLPMDRVHYLVTVEKMERTPKNYPRQAGVPKKKPIGS